AHREPHLVSPGWPVWLLAEIDQELLVQLQPAFLGVGVNLEQQRTLLGNIRVELIVPTAVERVGDVQSFAVEAQLQHLRAATGICVPDLRRLADDAADPDLAS